MKIQAIWAKYSPTKPNFKGEYRKLEIPRPLPYNKDAIEVVGLLDKNTDYTEQIKSAERIRGKIDVERTIGSFHTEPTNVIYYASPLEDVPDRTRTEVDYVVYDLEPKLPKVEGEVSENYFGTTRINYGKEYKKVQDYFFRLEMETQGKVDDIRRRMYAGIAVDNGQNLLNEYNGLIQYCKEMQKNIQEARNIYHSADWQRGTKEHFENLIDNDKRALVNAAQHLDYVEQKLESDKQLKKEITYQKNLLIEKLANYKKIKVINDRLAMDNFIDSSVNISSQIESHKNYISLLEQKLANLEGEIRQGKLHIIKYPEIVAAIKKHIKDLGQKLDTAKADLIPMFDKLKKHCIKHGIRG